MLQQALSFNAANRVSLPEILSQDRLGNQIAAFSAPVRTNHRLSEAEGQTANFPSMSFNISVI